jgi:hypothetical protein
MILYIVGVASGGMMFNQDCENPSFGSKVIKGYLLDPHPSFPFFLFIFFFFLFLCKSSPPFSQLLKSPCASPHRKFSFVLFKSFVK